MEFLQPRIGEAKTSEHHPHTSDASCIIPEHFKPHAISMRCGGNQEKDHRNEQKNDWFVRPTNEHIEMSTHPGPNIEKQEKSPGGDTQKT